MAQTLVEKETEENAATEAEERPENAFLFMTKAALPCAPFSSQQTTKDYLNRRERHLAEITFHP